MSLYRYASCTTMCFAWPRWQRSTKSCKRRKIWQRDTSWLSFGASLRKRSSPSSSTKISSSKRCRQKKSNVGISRQDQAVTRQRLCLTSSVVVTKRLAVKIIVGIRELTVRSYPCSLLSGNCPHHSTMLPCSLVAAS